MNYTDRIKTYCHAHKNSILDVSAVRYNEFADIPYKTLLKILNRLEDEGLIQSVAKGVYCIGKKRLTEDFLLSGYTDDGKGMVIGYGLFNKIGLTEYRDSKIEAYTNAITSQQKTIGQIRLKRADLFFDDVTIDVISLLEILDYGFAIKDCNYITYRNITELLAQSYSDEIFGKVVKAIRYKYSTWVSYTHIGVPDAPKELREKEIDVLYAKGNHCLGCLTTSGCYFIKGEQTNPKYQEHPNCHCKKGKYAPLAVTAICPLEKFTGYIFNEKYAYLGKKELFEEIFGYAIEDSEYLKTEYERQAREKYRSGDYSLKELKKYGQFISIQIELNTPKRGKATIVSGWNVKPNGNISCNTPYGG